MNVFEFILKLKEFKLRKLLKEQDDISSFHKLYKEVLSNIETVKSEILIHLWENESRYLPVSMSKFILLDNVLNIRDYRLSRRNYLVIKEDFSYIVIDECPLGDSYEIISYKGSYFVKFSGHIISLREATKHLTLYNDELKFIIKNKNKIYKEIINKLY